MKNKLSILLYVFGIGLFSCSEKDFPKSTPIMLMYLSVREDTDTLFLERLCPMEWCNLVRTLASWDGMDVPAIITMMKV